MSEGPKPLGAAAASAGFAPPTSSMASQCARPASAVAQDSDRRVGCAVLASSLLLFCGEPDGEKTEGLLDGSDRSFHRGLTRRRQFCEIRAGVSARVLCLTRPGTSST